MAQSDRSNSIWHNDVMITWQSWLVLVVSAANELAAQYSNTWLVLAVACFRNHPPPQLHLYRSATGCFKYAVYGGYSYVLYVQQQYFLHAHSSMLWMYWQQQVSVYQQHSRSIPPRLNTLTLSCTLPCQSLWELFVVEFFFSLLKN